MLHETERQGGDSARASRQLARRVLISGGAGFIGAHTAALLASRGYEVTVLDNLLPQIHGADPAASLTYAMVRRHARVIRGDVRNVEDWRAALRGQDAVVHLAAETGTGQSMYEISRYAAVNVQGTALLLDYLVNEKHGIRRLVIASSRSVYGEGRYSCAEHGIVNPASRRSADMQAGDFTVKCPLCGGVAEARATDEDSPPEPASVYAVTKLTQEQLMLAVGRSIGIPTVALRYQNVYGPGQSLLNPYTGILSIFSGALLDGRELNIFEDGTESRDFVYVEDVARANLLALERDKAAFQPVNVGTGRPVAVLDVATTLARAYGVECRYRISGDFRAGDIRHGFADTRRLRDALGLEPRYGFEEGIREFAAWVVEHRAALDSSGIRYNASIEEMRAKGLLGRSLVNS